MSTSPSPLGRIVDPRRQLWAATASGIRFHAFDPKSEMVRLDDVAHALSQICRFNGHSKHFYSVAQHSLLVARIVVEHLGRPDLEWTALLHDAPEAYLGDLISPVRRGLPDYKDAYDKVERVVFDALGVHTDRVMGLPEEVRRADIMALAIEARDLMPAIWQEWDLPFAPLRGWDVGPQLAPVEAKQQFWLALSRASGGIRG